MNKKSMESFKPPPLVPLFNLDTAEVGENLRSSKAR